MKTTLKNTAEILAIAEKITNHIHRLESGGKKKMLEIEVRVSALEENQRHALGAESKKPL